MLRGGQFHPEGVSCPTTKFFSISFQGWSCGIQDKGHVPRGRIRNGFTGEPRSSSYWSQHAMATCFVRYPVTAAGLLLGGSSFFISNWGLCGYCLISLHSISDGMEMAGCCHLFYRVYQLGTDLEIGTLFGNRPPRGRGEGPDIGRHVRAIVTPCHRMRQDSRTRQSLVDFIFLEILN